MFLLRHGQSWFNLHFGETGIDPGIEDPEFTPLGARQAEAAARQLASAALTRIIVSPYTRALQTAQPVLAIHRVPIDIMHEVRERAAFVCDVGSPPEALAARFPHHDSQAFAAPMVARRHRVDGGRQGAGARLPRGGGRARRQRHHARRSATGPSFWRSPGGRLRTAKFSAGNPERPRIGAARAAFAACAACGAPLAAGICAAGPAWPEGYTGRIAALAVIETLNARLAEP